MNLASFYLCFISYEIEAIFVPCPKYFFRSVSFDEDVEIL